MRESVVTIGRDRQLVGVMTSPDGLKSGPLACLLMNAGVIHRIGPHRINVKIARALAGRGISTLRLDLSGLGDSARAQGEASYVEQGVSDLQAAMDHLERTHGLQRFIVVGVCSGAVNAYSLALQDSRVVGILMFDGFWFPTLRTRLNRCRMRLRQASARKLIRRLGSALGLVPKYKAGGQMTAAGGPSHEEFAAAMETLTGRGVDVYIQYSGSFLELHNYAGQFADAFKGAPFLGRVRHEFVRSADHTLTTIAAQQTFITSLSRWADDIRSRLAPPSVQRASAQR